MRAPGAAIEYAGKRGGKPSPKQRDISLKLIALARAGKRVCRLKGGDPFVFGRGGEEALALVEAGIPFRVVPGISAGIGGLAYAGIPVTHRDLNHSVTFLTGHDQSGLTPSSIDWEGVARGAPVIVMYMAVKHLGADRRRADHRPGARAGEPVAIVAQCDDGSAAGAGDDARREPPPTLAASGLEPPAIVVVGEVVRLRAGARLARRARRARARRRSARAPARSGARRDAHDVMRARHDRCRCGEPFRQDARSRWG